MIGTDELDNENNITELTIAPDGRVFAFGTSRPVLEVLEALRPDDRRVRALLSHLRSMTVPAMPSMLHGRDAHATKGGTP
jgi:hypothetical protein